MASSQIKKAVLLNAGARYSTIFLGLLFSAVLARLLTPEDYGVVAVTVVFTTFFGILSDLGMGAGIIQNKELTDDDIGSIFAFSLRLSLGLAAAFALFSVPMAMFYGNNAYIPVGALLAVSLFFNTMNVVPNALMLKAKRFKDIALRILLACIVSGIAGIILAWAGLKYYALVIQAVLNSMFIFFWNYLSVRPPLAKRIQRESIAKIRSYSSFLFGFNVINYFARNTDNLLIGKIMGPSALGWYDKSYKLMLYPVNNLTHVITPVLHPILSEHQDDKKYIYDKYLQIVKLLSLLGAFITPFCFFASSEIIRILYGEQWLPSIACLKWMALGIWAQMILSSAGSIFQSLGDTRRLFFSGSMNAVLTVLCIIAGIIEGSIEAVARNVAIAYNLQFIATFYILVHLSFGLSVRRFLLRLLPDLGIAAIVAAAGWGVSFIPDMGLVLSFGVKLVAMGGVYLLVLALSGQLKGVIQILRGK
ncbi:MAG: lipopolysaccharide biosynthesis protein [Bacteroidales bacterium]|nr:lipopolysaccharide biosynthesis protein [Bacteroidales bacterium]